MRKCASCALSSVAFGMCGRALASMSGYDAGGYMINFGPDSRQATHFVELAVISKGGQFRF